MSHAVEDLHTLVEKAAAANAGRPVVLLGHSMGGAVALRLAARRPELPSAVIMLDGAFLPAEETARAMGEIAAGLRSPAYERVLQDVIGRMFMATDDAARRATIAAAMTRTAPQTVVCAFEAMLGYDAAPDLGRCAVPALYVGSAEPVADMARIRAINPAVMRAQTAGAGHFHQLEAPEQVHAMIERFLSVSGVAAAAASRQA